MTSGSDARVAMNRGSLNIERCASELVYEPGGSIRCELPFDHKGTHHAGHFSWTRGDNEGDPPERPWESSGLEQL